jgi:tryptophan synthase alpha chain
MSPGTSPDAPPASAAIDAAFRRAAAADRAAFIPFVTAGFPTRGATGEMLDALVAAGADIIELGIPFSDPLADGPTIQAASFAALKEGATPGWVLETLADFRARHDTPVVLFSYLNPVLGHGLDRFLTDAVDAGASGLLLTDLPAGADPDIEYAVNRSGLALIRLAAPTTPPPRLAEIARGASGFLYYVSRTGVTGAQTTLSGTLTEELESVRRQVRLPIGVGFGISTPEQARAVAAVADGVVVGSALVERLGSEGVDAAARLASSLSGALGRP